MPDSQKSENPNNPTANGAGQGPEKADLPGVRRIVAVASGKGGVGKSSVAVNLAAALVGQGKRVGLADLDIYGPSTPIMMGTSELPHPNEETHSIEPVVAHGMKLMSMGFFLDDEAPVVWRGPMAMSATKQFLRGVHWGELDYLIVDLPPGTGDIPLTLAQEVPLDGGIVVTTPQDVALADVERGAAMMRKVNAPILGVVDNMAGYLCPDCGERDDLFGARTAAELGARLGVPVLAEVPLVAELCRASDEGTPFVLRQPDHPVTAIFEQLATQVESSLDRASADANGPIPTSIGHDDVARIVRIEWSDGNQTQYSYDGLRGWCPCAQCQGHSGQQRFVTVDDARFTRAEPVGRYALRFEWADGHGTGMYTFSYLMEIADYPECRL